MQESMKKGFETCSCLDDFEILFPKRNLSDGKEVVRLAPSPTGMPHIGTAMQAIINRVLANKSGGVFILRIEDTDQARSVPGTVEAIKESLSWLGTEPNEGVDHGGAYGPYLQSERLKLYKIAADFLIEQGHAYHCFCSEERLAKVRTEQTLAKVTPKYDRKCSFLRPEEVQERLARGERNVIRLRIHNTDEKIRFVDLVRGEIEFDAKMLDDNILLKSDGFPTYHLASIVDDHFMRITTVVRGEEWISSTPKHILLYRAFGWNAPRFLHTVLLRDEQRRKLSKRSGDTSIGWFRGQGYCPEGFRNFLTRIMWAHPKDKDIYPLDEFEKLMTTEALPCTGPIVDMKLLGFINSKYIAENTPSELRQKFVDYLNYVVEHNVLLSKKNATEDEKNLSIDILKKLRDEIIDRQSYADSVFALEPERYHKYSDIIWDGAYFFNTTYKEPTPLLLEKHGRGANVASILRRIMAEYSVADDHDAWNMKMRKVASDIGVKDKIVFMLARVAVCGCEKTPPLFEIMRVLGQDMVVKRVEQVIKSL